MVSTFTPNRGYEQPGTGDYVDGWGVVLNNNFAIIDSNISSTLTVSLSSSNVTLNPTQAQNMAFLLTGTLSANVSLIYPAKGGFFLIRNATAGAFTVTVITAAGGSQGVLVHQGQIATLYSDGTNVAFADDTARVPIGAIVDFGGSNAPAGWLLCFGQAVPRAAYPALFTAIGITWGGGDGSTTFNLPDFRGRLRAGRDDMGGTPANRLTTAGSGVNGIALGAVGGAQNVTLTSGQIPALIPNSAFSSSSSTTVAPGGTAIVLTDGNNIVVGSGASTAVYPTSSTGSLGTSTTTNTTVSINPSGGSSHNNVQPSAVTNSIIRAF